MVLPYSAATRRTAWKVTVAGSTSAASTAERLSGTGMTRRAVTCTRVAKAPCGGASASTPLASANTVSQWRACPATHWRQRPHAGPTAPTTRWPTRSPSTPAPTAETEPVHSCPKTAGGSMCPSV